MGDVEEQKKLNGKIWTDGTLLLAGWLGQLIELNLAWSVGRRDRSTTPSLPRSTTDATILHCSSGINTLSLVVLATMPGIIILLLWTGREEKRTRSHRWTSLHTNWETRCYSWDHSFVDLINPPRLVENIAIYHWLSIRTGRHPMILLVDAAL